MITGVEQVDMEWDEDCRV